MASQKPILITGAHRTGTTWVGKMLSASPDVGYIQEPFNLQHRPGICRAHFKHWFTYITAENQSKYYDDVKRTVSFSYNLGDEIKAADSTRDLMRLGRDYFNFKKYSLKKARPLIKDPIAFFSAEWLVEAFDSDVVVLIRHPAAFISGLKARKWEFEFSNFLDQPLLMRDYLSPFSDEIEAFSRERKPIVEQGILLWNIFYSVIDSFRKKHSSWLFIKHEDLALDPVKEFSALYQKLNLPFEAAQREFIEEYTSASNPSKAPAYKKTFGSNIDLSVKRSSQFSIKSWKERLTPSEIDNIKRQTSRVADRFYSQDDWV